MKQERLLGITTFLLAHHVTTAAELAARFGVSVRTIYRDLDALSVAGVPVYANRGTGGGISLLKEYTIARLPMKEQEREALFMAVSEFTATRHPHAASALEKLRALWDRPPETEMISVNFSGYGSPPDESETFSIIRRAMLERRVLSFDYFSSKGEHTRRTVEPIKLVFHGYCWYAYGFCRDRQDYRVFKVMRMCNAQTQEEHFAPRAGMTYEEFTQANGPRPDRPATTLTLLFYPRAKYRVLDMFGPARVKEREDGTMEVTCVYWEDEWVYGTLMSFGCDVEVLSPPHIRSILRERLGKAAQYYAPDRSI